MLVIIGIGNIDLTNLVVGIITLHFREHTHLQPPVGGDADIFNHITLHRKFARQRIAKTV